VQILTTSALFGTIAASLTEKENHRTGSSFENALVVKTCVFMVVNTFGCMIYIAFVKVRSSVCAYGV
jgi:hypothetical protein